MAQEVDLQHLGELVEQLEANLQELKQALNAYNNPKAELDTRDKDKASKSLYGIFPRSDVSWDDFRQARTSWSHRTEKL